MKPKVGSLGKKISKINKSLARLAKEKKRKIQITRTTNERGDIATNLAERI